ncbi:MAG: hypothetical protein JSR77_04295 [Planctomycetes bacterium]|nr:hypothetical protein [Planctomycetota bacterium]
MHKILAIITPAILCTLAGAQTYRLVDLGTLGGQSNGFALGQSGVAGGTATQSDSHFRPVLFPSSGNPDQLASLPSEREHVVFGFDPQGRPIGTAYTLGAMGVSAFRIDPQGPTLLGPFAARAVNASGDIIGTTRIVGGDGLTLPVACIYHAGALTTLPSLGGRTSQALGIDASGRIVGSSTTLNEAASRPCMWTSTTRVIDLGTLGGSGGQAAASAYDSATGVSTVVGHSISSVDGLRHATRWRVNAGGTVLSRIDLGVLRAGVNSHAASINASGDTVGTSDFHAVLFQGGAVRDLNSLLSAPAAGWTLQSAAAINDAGQIVGTGTLLGFPRAFMLEPFRCFADFNQDGGIDGADVEAFFLVWEAGLAGADVNADGGVDGGDVEAFFMVWSAGGC